MMLLLKTEYYFKIMFRKKGKPDLSKYLTVTLFFVLHFYLKNYEQYEAIPNIRMSLLLLK